MNVKNKDGVMKNCSNCHQTMRYLGVLAGYDVYKCFDCVVVSEVKI